jgi:hypothetical protein
MSHRRIVPIAAALFVVAFAGVAPARPAAVFVQRVAGAVLLTSPAGPAVARNQWVQSQGAVNGVSGYVFEVDPRTHGKRFIVRLTQTSGFDDTNITFYSDLTAGQACGEWDFLNPFEAGRACGTHAILWTFTGGPISFAYEAGDGVDFTNIAESGGGMSLAGRINFTTGTDLAFEGKYVYVGSEDPSPDEGGLHIIDVSNPRSPVEVGHLGCPAQQNDVAVWRGLVVMAIDSASTNVTCNPGLGTEGVRVVDVRDPAKPKQIAFFTGVTGEGAHTVTRIRDTGLVYLNNQFSQRTDVLDLRPVLAGGKPVIAKEISNPNLGCHDISISGTRAFCAATYRTEIWDITDPLAPVVLGRIVNPFIDIHHSTAVEGNTLIIGTEHTGAEAASGCDLGSKGPFGAIWFYDVSNPALARPLGYFNPPETYLGVRCTAHNFNVIPGKNLIVAGWYKAGTRLIDFSDPANPVQKGFIVPDGSVTWSAYWHDGFIYTGDMHRGMDVIAVEGLSPRSTVAGNQQVRPAPKPKPRLPATGVPPFTMPATGVLAIAVSVAAWLRERPRRRSR